MTAGRVVVLCGGRSQEHEVSMISARSLLAAVEGTGLSATVVVITRAGRWLKPTDSRAALAQGAASEGGEDTLQAALGGAPIDVVFPLLHGPFGEDGTVQGMLELAGLPYVGSGVLASALCMDKAMTKEVLRASGIDQVDSVLLGQGDAAALAQPDGPLWRRLRALGSPCFVKPANLGSSVGIGKATDEPSLRRAIAHAFTFDRRVVVEQAVAEARELEVAVLGNDQPQASPVGEITYAADFYDYATKYTEGRARMHIPAAIDAQLSERVRALAVRAFGLLDCAGLARIDFFYQNRSGRLWLNEVNTMPGFTPFSMFPGLWQAGGLPYPSLVRRLMDLAIERHRGRPTGQG